MLSIVIPVWNEAHKILRDIQNIQNYIIRTSANVEVIIVDDGSDDNISEVINKYKNKNEINLKLISSKPHSGKGQAVKIGINHSKGLFICIMDSGNTVPLKYIDQAVKIINEENLDFVWGSRHLADSKILYDRVWYRKISSYLFRTFILYSFNLHYLTDSQCGFKIFKGVVAKEIWKDCKIDGFLFDIVVLLILTEKNFKGREFPIEWTCDRDSRLSFLKNLFGLAKQIYELKSRFKSKTMHL